jgi:multidrug resistance efflux pump
VALTAGDCALQARSAISFIVKDEITIVGIFSQYGFQAIRIGTPVDIVSAMPQGALLLAYWMPSRPR